MSVSEELEKLQQLRDSGALSEDEYAAAKAKVLNGPAWNPFEAPLGTSPMTGEALQRSTNQWAALLHLSLLSGCLAPLAGYVVPILIWQLKKDDLPGLDVHGRNAVNWIISSLVYAVVSGLLIFFVIGIPLLLAVVVCGIVFPIIAAVKANQGEVWKYPLTIEFIQP